ncbi:MAG TPA: MlaD family protein [Solirubrobacteraceae bacterium]|jgi:phospholipid/cholesterol/gamma-HCH transport system substrate-binding protein|nr:MlaD family protein [Solirubrobacteraceae bacterium]
MRKAIRDHARDFAAIIVLAVIAVGVGGYILTQQRMRFPIVDEKPIRLKAEFSTAQAVIPGQGQTVRVSGVKVGDVGKVELKDGRALVELQVLPEYRDLIRQDATVLLRSKTALKDMFIEVQPGDGPVAKDGFTIPVANTAPDVNPDELWAMLDDDTRDYLRLLIDGASGGLEGRGDDLREVFERFEPTHRDLARINTKVAERRENLRRLITNLNRLNGELARKDDDLAQLVDTASRVFRAFAAEEGNITTAVDRLPEALEQTTDTLVKVERFANILRPATERLGPAVRGLDEANRSLIPLANEGTPILRDRVRPFVREAQPLVEELGPAAGRLARSTPDLTRSFVVLNHLFNMVGYNKDGREGADDPDRDEGYLFWIAWLGHVGGAVFSTSDNGGTLRPVALQANCQTIKSSLQEQPQLGFLQALTDALFDPRICPEGVDPSLLDQLQDQVLGNLPDLPLPRERRRRGGGR